MANLFGDDEPVDKPKRKKKPVSSTAHAKWIAAFFEQHEKRLGVKPRFRAREGKHVKDLLAEYDEQTAMGLIPLFFASRDRRIAGSDYSVGVLYQNAQLLLIEANGHGRRPVDALTQDNLDAVRRGSRR